MHDEVVGDQAEPARRLERRALTFGVDAGIDPEDYAALVAEIEGLSDEEARQLLGSEDSPKT